MSLDRARTTDDRRLGYRGVVFQQGRVLVEHDLNPAHELAAGALRDATRDVVGPVGTPDDGFGISVPPGGPAFEFHLRGGTMYVGGVRAEFPAGTYPYSAQPDWLAPPPPEKPSPPAEMKEFIYLEVSTGEVSAEEDRQLADAALAGIDTAGRLKVFARVKRLRVDATDCLSAADAVAAAWQQRGYRYDPDIAALTPASTLKIGFAATVALASPCDPEPEGGFLHPDNQLIRIKRVGPTSLLWGFDNASFLYRVTKSPDGNTLAIGPPRDETRILRVGQWVEVLRPAALLGNGEFAAEADGDVRKLAAGYNPTDGTIRLEGAALPGEYLSDLAGERPLFVRVWEARVEFTPDAPVALGGTGLTATVSQAGPGAGEFWQVAARPHAPHQVIPLRYLDAPQQPEGPVRWVCPLAVIRWTADGVGTVLSDCRKPFDNLVELTTRPGGGGGCCALTITPEDARGPRLQELLTKVAGEGKPRVKVCFRPGVYALDQPLRLTNHFSGITLDGCGAATIRTSERAKPAAFLDGLVVLTGCDGATIRGLRFEPPPVPVVDAFRGRGVAGARVDALAQIAPSAVSAVAVQAIGCRDLALAECDFEFPFPPNAEVFAAGLFGRSTLTGLTVRGCRFGEPRPPLRPDPLPGPELDKLNVIRQQIRNQLKQIGRAIAQFHDKNPGKVLEKWSGLFPQPELTPALFITPFSGKKVPPDLPTNEFGAWVEANSDFVLVPFKREDLNTNPTALLAFERLTPGAGLVAFLRRDGSTASAGPGAVRDMVIDAQATRAGVPLLAVEGLLTRAAFGVLLQPVLLSGFQPTGTGPPPSRRFVWVPELDRATVAGNVCDGIGALLFAVGEAGAADVRDNNARGCDGLAWAVPYPISIGPATPEVIDRRAFLRAPAPTLAEAVGQILPTPDDSPDGLTITPHFLAARVSNNELNTAQPEGAITTGPGLLLIGGPGPFWLGDPLPPPDPSDRSVAAVTGNYLRSRSLAPTVVITETHETSVTGNVVENMRRDPIQLTLPNCLTLEPIPPRALDFFRGTAVAVTGNVFRGSTNLSLLKRLGSPPLDTWDIWNTTLE